MTDHAKLTVETLDMSSLQPHPRNPRQHPEPGTPAWEALKASLEHDYFDPIVFNTRNGYLVSGHLRTKVLASMGITKADCVVVDYDEPTHLARMIAANRQVGEWDEPALAELLKGCEDLALAGFTDEQMLELQAEQAPDRSAVDAEPQTDRAGELAIKWGVVRGQVWELGQHRLMCGDSTSKEDVARLMGGDSPQIMVTDPPYGVEYDPAWRAEAGVNKNPDKMGKVANDDRADWSAAWMLFQGNVAYVYHADVMSSIVQASLELNGFNIRSQIIWAKDRMALSRGDYHWQHEPCWYGVRDGKPGNRNDDRTQTTLWTIPSRDDSGHGHGTQKPVECMSRPIRNHTCELVYDPFSGSGTTLIACEQLNRKCRAMEIDPGYVAVALQRWADATGKTPRLSD